MTSDLTTSAALNLLGFILPKLKSGEHELKALWDVALTTETDRLLAVRKVQELQSQRDDALAAANRVLCHKWESLLDAINGLAAWGRQLDQDRLYNLGKWAGIIGCGLSVDQPELLIVIDEALEQGVKDAARLAEIERLDRASAPQEVSRG